MIRFLSILMLACLLGCASTPISVKCLKTQCVVENPPAKGEVVYERKGEDVSITVKRDGGFNPFLPILKLVENATALVLGKTELALDGD